MRVVAGWGAEGRVYDSLVSLSAMFRLRRLIDTMQGSAVDQPHVLRCAGTMSDDSFVKKRRVANPEVSWEG